MSEEVTLSESKPRELNRSLRELHDALEAAALGERWLRDTARDLAQESAAIAAILAERVLSFPPTTSQLELSRRFKIGRDRVRTIEGWLVRRIRGRVRYQMQHKRN